MKLARPNDDDGCRILIVVDISSARFLIIGQFVVGSHVMKLKITIWVSVGLIVALVVAFAVFLYPVVDYARQNAAKRRSLAQITAYTNIIQECLALRSNLPTGSHLGGDDQRIPQFIRGLQPRKVFVHERSVQIEFAGGFDHFGYRFEQDYPNTNTWTLYWHTESGRKQLVSVPR